MGTAQKLTAGVLSAFMFVIVVTLVVLASTRRFSQATANVRTSNEELLALGHLSSTLATAESSARGFALTNDSAFIASYEAAAAALRADLDALDSLTTSTTAMRSSSGAAGASGATVRADRIRAVREMRRLVVERLARLDDLRSQPRSATVDGRVVMDSVQTMITALEASARAQLHDQLKSATHTARVTDAVAAIGAVLACILLSFAVLFMAREFTVRRVAETAVREGQAQLTQFLDSLPIGAVVIDAAGQPSFANTTALSMLGAATLHDLTDRSHETLIPLWREDDHASLRSSEDPMRAALRGLAAQREGLELQIGAGTRIPIEISAAPVFDSNGNVAFAIATFSDITERVRARHATELARQAAEDSNRAKSDFLARMSHELRTPLNSVIGFANILLKNRNANLQDQDLDYLKRIHSNGRHLLVLINDILDLSKIESGKVQVEWETVDLAALLSDTVQQLEPQARPEVMLSADVPPGTHSLRSDPARLRQILINLVGNALKFTQTGSVTIAVETDEGMMPARIRVTDTGIGIPQDRLNAIFDAFEQADRTTSREYGGTGLGLPISRALCELLGYALTVHSEPGVGTEFVIDLLAQSAAA
jgi:PAS domain S-box-containing protein